MTYKLWKRRNVTLRGMKEVGVPNGVYGSFGEGLYTACLSNKALAKEYGKVYFVVGAVPSNPKKVQGWNAAEIFIQNVVDKYCKENGILCRVISSQTGLEIAVLRYEDAKEKFKNVVVDNYEERLDFFAETDLHMLIERVLRREVSNAEVSKHLRGFNNFEMPLSQRKRLILNDKAENERFINYLKK